MENNEQRKEFRQMIENHFKIEELNNGLNDEEISNVYLWGMLRENNYFNINPKLYIYKGTFWNLGYPFPTNEKIIKHNITIDNKTILIDVAKAFSGCESMYNNSYVSNYFGMVISEKEIALDALYDKIELMVKKYFESDYKYYSDEHRNMVFNYFNQMFDMECDVLIPGKTLKAEDKLFRISKGFNSFKFEKDDFVYFPFGKPYSDYVSWKDKW